MHFDKLKDKCEYFRGLTDYRLTPNSYVIAMLDGRTFSKLIKNKYEKPFDMTFMQMMDETAAYILKNVQGAKFAYVQSDEISILITDFDTPETDSPFSYRICKLQSILAGMASGMFNKLTLLNEFRKYNLKHGTLSIEQDKFPYGDMYSIVEKQKLVEFDCKVWNVPGYNEAYCHFLWRQNDCTRNSKQQAAQTYLPHKELNGLNADAQIAKLLEEKGIDWNDYSNAEKYGRIIYQESVPFSTDHGVVERNVWLPHAAAPFSEEDNVIRTLIPTK